MSVTRMAGKTNGWRVRLMQGNKKVVDKFFGDATYGGQGMAALAARKYEEEQLQGKMRRKKVVANV